MRVLRHLTYSKHVVCNLLGKSHLLRVGTITDPHVHDAALTSAVETDTQDVTKL